MYVGLCCITKHPNLSDSKKTPIFPPHISVSWLVNSSAAVTLAHSRNEIQLEGQKGWKSYPGLSLMVWQLVPPVSSVTRPLVFSLMIRVASPYDALQVAFIEAKEEVAKTLVA